MCHGIILVSVGMGNDCSSNASQKGKQRLRVNLRATQRKWKLSFILLFGQTVKGPASFNWHPKILLWTQGHREGRCSDELINNQTTVIWVKQARVFIDYTAGTLVLHPAW